jgi:hypothetical protein
MTDMFKAQIEREQQSPEKESAGLSKLDESGAHRIVVQPDQDRIAPRGQSLGLPVEFVDRAVQTQSGVPRRLRPERGPFSTGGARWIRSKLDSADC